MTRSTRFAVQSIAWMIAIFALAAAHAQPNQDAPMRGYLFAYFTGNGPGQEQIHFALSQDGFHYKALNDNRRSSTPRTSVARAACAIRICCVAATARST